MTKFSKIHHIVLILSILCRTMKEINPFVYVYPQSVFLRFDVQNWHGKSLYHKIWISCYQQVVDSTGTKPPNYTPLALLNIWNCGFVHESGWTWRFVITVCIRIQVQRSSIGAERIMACGIKNCLPIKCEHRTISRDVLRDAPRNGKRHRNYDVINVIALYAASIR